jgi:hypothetical protein
MTEENPPVKDKGFWNAREWKLKDKRSHYYVYVHPAGLVRVKCRHCEYVVIGEKSLTLLVLNIIHKHLADVHNIPIDEVSQ